MKTEALWYLGKRNIEIKSVEIPEPEAHEVLVEMEACGVCGWDILAYSGGFGQFHAYPFRAGHEGIGRVIRRGSLASGIQIGQRVACHELPIDERGGGLMARHAVRPWNKVSVMPEPSAIPVEKWIVEPVACVVNGIMYSGIQPGDSVALVGAGYMGMLMLQALRRTLAGKVTVFEPDGRRLELARKSGSGMGGWDFVQTVPGESPAGHIRSCDVVIETAGSDPALELAFKLARPYAIIENFAWHHHRHEFDLERWHVDGLRILNIQPQMNPSFDELFPRAIALMAAGAISNEGLVTHVAPFGKAEGLYAAALDRTGGYIKGVIEFGTER
ncbi:MAG: alcohol dehydrogenase catalytic domain-containing protein [Spirochaetes bacterium]|nr:alcohol dehydrogenase catalytic domain-containing protein [Spirochaetota bacterium]